MRGTGLGFCALSLGAVLAAQQQPPQTFRGGVELVVLNVTVVDTDGKPVRPSWHPPISIRYLDAGVYMIRATVLEGGIPTGTVTSVVRKR